MLNLSRNSGTYDGAAFFQDDSGIAEKKIPLNRLVSWGNQPFQPYTQLNDGRFNIMTAVYLADLSAGNQSVLADWLKDNPKATINEKASQRLISRNGFGFDEDEISGIISGKVPKAKLQPVKEPEDNASEPETSEKFVIPAEPPTSDSHVPKYEVEYDDLPDVSVSFDRETIRRTIGKVDDSAVQEYLNLCLQQEDLFIKFLDIYKQS